jgi:threonine/homoserine/homoserine lactone efflux protein
MTHTLLVYLAAVLAVSLFPGPDMLFIMSQSLTHGKKYGIAATLGICAGCFVHIFAVSLGLSTLLVNSTLAFKVVKYLGAGYLLYLGLTSLCQSKMIAFQDNNLAPIVVWKKVFLRGFMTNVLNPKVALFFLAFLPQFVVMNHHAISLQFLLLGLIFNGIGTCVNLTVALFFAVAKNWLVSLPRAFMVQQKITGAILIGLGLRLAMSF